MIRLTMKSNFSNKIKTFIQSPLMNFNEISNNNTYTSTDPCCAMN